MKNPADYDGSRVCARCGSGWPNCADINPETGQHFTHAETCDRYWHEDDPDPYWLCPECEQWLEDAHPRRMTPV